jgi:hypothetical protein
MMTRTTSKIGMRLEGQQVWAAAAAAREEGVRKRRRRKWGTVMRSGKERAERCNREDRNGPTDKQGLGGCLLLGEWALN